jgi:hypothetical protein
VIKENVKGGGECKRKANTFVVDVDSSKELGSTIRAR